MNQNDNNSQSANRKKKVGLGIALTAAAVAAIGGYFLYGSKNAPQNRQRVKSWMLKAKAEVLERLEAADVITKEEYDALIESIAERYSRLKEATRRDISGFKTEMKNYWPQIESGAKSTAKVAAKAAAQAATQDVIHKVTNEAVRKRRRRQRNAEEDESE